MHAPCAGTDVTATRPVSTAELQRMMMMMVVVMMMVMMVMVMMVTARQRKNRRGRSIDRSIGITSNEPNGWLPSMRVHSLSALQEGVEVHEPEHLPDPLGRHQQSLPLPSGRERVREIDPWVGPKHGHAHATGPFAGAD